MRHFLAALIAACLLGPETPAQDNPHQQRQARRPPPLAIVLVPFPGKELQEEGIALADKLNAGLQELQRLLRPGVAAPEVKLDARVRRCLNAVRKKDPTDVGVLRRLGKLQWPAALRADAYAAGRKQVDKLLPEALKQARKGELADRRAQDLGKAVEKLKKELDNQVGDLSATEYVESNRFLRGLDQALTALKREDVRHFLAEADELVARGKTVAGLVRYMRDKGLRFAPPVPGDEAAYRELERTLTAYAERVRALRGQK